MKPLQTTPEEIQERFHYLNEYLVPDTNVDVMVERIRGVVLSITTDEEYAPHKLYGKKVRDTVTNIKRELIKLSKEDRDAAQAIWTHLTDNPELDTSDPLLLHNALIADCADFLDMPTPKSFSGQQGLLIVDLLDQVREECLSIELSAARTDPFLTMVRDVAELIYPDKVYADGPRDWVKGYIISLKN